ncbi:MAG: hypothetical protein RSD51_03330 [Malacoplasma sp.]
MGYFNLEKTLKKFKLDCESDSLVLAIQGPRNVGKTTDALEYYFGENNVRVDENNKIGFLRMTDVQLKTFKSDFNAYYSNRFIISGELVYTLVSETIKIKDQEQTIYKRGVHIGYCGSINTYKNLKSVRASKLRYIFFDEYNEISTYVDLYSNFINLFKTLSRFNKIFLLMMGNRDTPNNEFMVKWKIIPSDKPIDNDIFYNVSKRIKFLELGFNQYADLENEKTIAYELASFDDNAKNYLDGGYMISPDLFIVPYDIIIKKTFYPYFLVQADKKVFAFGSFKKNNLECFALVSNNACIKKCYELDLEILGITAYAFATPKTTMTKEKNIKNLMTSFLEILNTGKMYFDSFENKEIILKYIIMNSIKK